MLILVIFFKVVLGGGVGWWIFVGGGGLYLWVVVAGCAVYGRVLLKVLCFFFLLFSFAEVFGFEICWRTGDCGCSLWRWFLVGGDCHGAVCLYIVGF